MGSMRSRAITDGHGQSLGATARGLALSCHPLPSLAVTALVAGMAARADTTWLTATLATTAILAGQLSIGWSNDARDAERDRAVQRSDKPAAAGQISARAVGVAALTAVAAGVALAAPLGWRSLLLVLLGIACGWAYNFGVKATPLSWLPYAVAFATLPAVVTFASTDARWPPTWALVAGGLFGVAAHVANALPDLLEDQATGVRGLPHRLGTRASALLGPALLAAASFVIVLVPPHEAAALRVVGVSVTVVVADAAAALALRNPGSRRYFFAVIAIAGLDLLLFGLSGAKLA
jgi:4-hydroxybenzoate polyprenyltransferase